MGAADEDPVRLGLIASFARPGGNITGVVNVGHELAGKRLQLLREVVPQASRVAILLPSKGFGGPGGHLRETQAAAPALGIKLQLLEVHAPDDLEGVSTAHSKGVLMPSSL